MFSQRHGDAHCKAEHDAGQGRVTTDEERLVMRFETMTQMWYFAAKDLTVVRMTSNNGQSNLAIGGIAANWKFRLLNFFFFPLGMGPV